MEIDKLLLEYCKAIDCAWLCKENKETNKQYRCQSKYCTARNFMIWIMENKIIYDYPKLEEVEHIEFEGQR